MIVRVSRREKYLQAILDQIREIARTGVAVHVLFSYDRASPEVALTLEGIHDYRPGWFSGVDLTVHIEPAPEPILSPGGQRWMQVLQQQYTQLLHKADCQIVMLWDDDMLFPQETLDALVATFADPPDRVEAQTLFLWDSLTEHNAAFPEHWSAVAFRVYREDQFPDDFVVHCPEMVARSNFCVKLASPVVNYGYLTDTDRARAWGAQKEAGKIDAHSLCLIRPPRLRSIPPSCVIQPTRKSTRTLESF